MLGITIGNFDGVHLGHAALIDALRREVGPSGEVAVVTFDPSPAEVLGHPRTPRLTIPSERARRLSDAGVDRVVECRTDRALLELEPRAFLELLTTKLGRLPDRIAIGPDFRFGRDRTGSIETLETFLAASGGTCEVVSERRVVLADGHEVPVRSSMVRRLLEIGRVEDASRLLGRVHTLVGTVVSGDQRGRTIGIPTANLDLRGAMLPADGVYGGVAILPDGTRRRAAISVGTKPTFVETPRVAEVHLLDHEAPVDDYGWSIDVGLRRRFRGQETYDDLESFLRQIDRDLLRIREEIPLSTDHEESTL